MQNLHIVSKHCLYNESLKTTRVHKYSAKHEQNFPLYEGKVNGSQRPPKTSVFYNSYLWPILMSSRRLFISETSISFFGASAGSGATETCGWNRKWVRWNFFSCRLIISNWNSIPEDVRNAEYVSSFLCCISISWKDKVLSHIPT